MTTSLWLPIDEVGLDPGAEPLATELAGGKVEKAALRIVDGRVKLPPVQHQERFERRVADALVAVNERMIQNEGVRERGTFGREADVQVGAVKRGTRLRDSCLKGSEITNGRRAT